MVTLEAPGEEVQNQGLKDKLYKRIQSLFEESISDNSFIRKRFPGSHPISLSKESLEGNTEYLVCEKSDGVRYLLYIAQIIKIRGINECQGFLIDRKYNFWRITVLIPASVVSSGDCLYDVEVVLDYGTDLRILIFDTLFSGGLSYMKNNYYERLQTAWFGLIYPVRESMIKSKIAIQIYLKDFFRSSDIDYLWNHIICTKKLPHECDGLVFTSVLGEYIIGTNSNILKWKPSHLNTLDFSIRKNGDVYELCTLGRGLEKFAELKGIITEQLFDGDIVECCLDNNEWKVYKKRSDKTAPNSTDTAYRILKSIKDNISIEELIEHFAKTKKVKLN